MLFLRCLLHLAGSYALSESIINDGTFDGPSLGLVNRAGERSLRNVDGVVTHLICSEDWATILRIPKDLLRLGREM